jgi:hypothetical protein
LRALDKPSLVNQFNLFRPKGFVLAHRPIDRVAIDATNRFASFNQELGKPTGDHALADPFLATQGESSPDQTGLFRCWVSLLSPYKFSSSRSNQFARTRISIAMNLANVEPRPVQGFPRSGHRIIRLR